MAGITDRTYHRWLKISSALASDDDDVDGVPTAPVREANESEASFKRRVREHKAVMVLLSDFANRMHKAHVNYKRALELVIFDEANENKNWRAALAVLERRYPTEWGKDTLDSGDMNVNIRLEKKVRTESTQDSVIDVIVSEERVMIVDDDE